MQLGHNMSVDLYVEQVVAAAKLVVVRLLGGESYWPYGVEQLHAACRERGIKLAMLPGDEQPDPALATYATLEEEAAFRLWRYCVERSEEHTSELQSLMRISYAVFCLKKKKLPTHYN